MVTPLVPRETSLFSTIQVFIGFLTIRVRIGDGAIPDTNRTAFSVG